MSDDPRRLIIPESIADDSKAFELLSVWATRTGQISVMTGTGSGLDHNPAAWGEILAAIARNIALSVKNMTGVESSATMAAIKEALDRRWDVGAAGVGKHYRSS